MTNKFTGISEETMNGLKEFSAPGIVYLANMIQEKFENGKEFSLTELIEYDFEKFSKKVDLASHNEFTLFLNKVVKLINRNNFGFQDSDFAGRNQMQKVLTSFLASVKLGINHAKVLRENNN